MSQKFSTVVMTIGLSIFLLITCACEGENQKAEASFSTDSSYQTKKQEKKQTSIVKTEFGQTENGQKVYLLLELGWSCFWEHSRTIFNARCR